MIEVKNISKNFKDTRVLDNVSVSFKQGITNLVIGQSGSGKTVLLKAIVGLIEIDEGEIIYGGDIIFNELSFKERKGIRREIGMLFQGGALFDSATAEENIIYPMDMFTTWSKEEKLERANFCLARVNLENKNKLYPDELSGGMKKRAAIARAIALNPKYLFCDEPNSGLDPKTAIVIDNLIKELTEEFNMTTIVNTHDMNSVMEIGSKVVFIADGLKCWEGTNEDILNSENKILNEFIFANSLARQVKQIGRK